MKRLVSRNCRKEQEGLEKPADVGDMPLSRADIWHGLDDIIFGDKRFAQVLSKTANSLVLVDERLAGWCLDAERAFFHKLFHRRFPFFPPRPLYNNPVKTTPHINPTN